MTKPELTLHEGGRAKEANDMNAHFADAADKVMLACDHMAGYVIVVWDDEGFMTETWKIGSRNPMPRVMVPDYVCQTIKASMVK